MRALLPASQSPDHVVLHRNLSMPSGRTPKCARRLVFKPRTGDFMTSIRRFVYAAALTLTAFSFAPSLASAQEARGRFVLTHEVHWQKTLLPAGEYEFSFRPDGP